MSRRRITSWTLTLPLLPDSMNVRERSSFWKRKRELGEIRDVLRALAELKQVPPARGRRRVTITIHKSIRSRVKDDPANRDSRAKSVLDAMVKEQLLVDDSDRWLDWRGVHEGEKRAEKQTVVQITDLWGAA